MLAVSRQANGYRFYTEHDILIQKIKMLRSSGISISDIRLLFGNIITLEELIRKRKREIENEYGLHSKAFEDISILFDEYKKEQTSCWKAGKPIVKGYMTKPIRKSIPDMVLPVIFIIYETEWYQPRHTPFATLWIISF